VFIKLFLNKIWHGYSYGWLWKIKYMKTRVTLAIIVVTGFLIFICCQFVSAIDAPHNASNNVSCGSCHGAVLLDSPFWGGSGSYDQLCLSCHTAPFGEYSDINAPLVKTHSSLTTSNKYGDWTRECRNCHDPHYQRQKNYKPTDASRLYLATGTIMACVYNGNGTSTLTYSTITYKTGWDSTKLTKKTGDYRRTILFPNVNKLGYNYPLVAIDTVGKRITVTGDATVYLYPPTTFAATYGQYIKDIMDISADGSGNNKPVKFFDQTGTNSFADGDTTYNGVCEVCHTRTTHFRYGGSGTDQHHMNVGNADATNCISCHPHTNGFAHGGGGGTSCDSCHGNSGSHYRHTDVDPPATSCDDCHNIDSYPKFADNQDLTNTTVCNTCHSPDGAFNGVSDAVIGAKDNWPEGAYQSGTYPTALRAGKEKWCAGCHDNVPSVVKGTTAPDIVGDNSTYGYYLDAHGDTGYGVSRQGVSYSKGECLHCHDVSQTGHGGQLFNRSVGFCLKCHDNTTTYATTAIKNRSYSYRAGNYSADTLDSIEKFYTNPPNISSHSLTNIKTFINGKWGYDANSNACAACHNPHRVQGDPEHSDAAKSSGTRGYPVARPSEHSTNYNNLWGDDASEKMNNYTADYQAPYRSGGATYEPDGSAITNGSNLTDYATFCTDCHNTTYTTINSTPLRRNVKVIDWNTEKHGKGNGNAALISPYTTGNNYAMSCTDCHEPHGSANLYLTRKEVNNGIVSVTGNPMETKGTEWASLCERCHLRTDLEQLHHTPPLNNDCTICHPITPMYVPCINCHYHGSTFTGSGYDNYPIF
jgi:predicted CXXCH cytochrome family protein